MGSGGIVPRILDLGSRRRRVVSFTLRPLWPEERAPGTHYTGDWVGPRADWTRWRKKFPASAGNWVPDHPARSPALNHCILHLTTLDEAYRLWSSSLCHFLQDPPSSLLGPNILNTLYSKTLSLCSSVGCEIKFCTHTYNWQNYISVYFNL
jgi:hypothetical protein